jgi:glycosyltransferase involved in cell wall biosynthesis
MAMRKLLTIAIPTYNRAECLDKQLEWLSNAIKGFESDCEILVSDNCSSDHTPTIIKKWQEKLNNITFHANRNPENLGLIKNLIYCLTANQTKYVWTIGDDDNIQERAVAYVVNKLKEKQDISLLFLNFSGHHKLTNEPVHPPTIVGNRWFDADTEDGEGDGKAIFEHCFAKSIGAVSFLSASVYRSDLIKRALDIWAEAASNWLSLAYLAGFCAANGKVIVTKETYMECIIGVSYWQKEPKSALLMQYKDIPEVILKLRENGYSQQFCRQMMLQNFREVNLKVFLGALRRWPLSAIKILVPFLSMVSIAALEVAPIRSLRLAEVSEVHTQEVTRYKS